MLVALIVIAILVVLVAGAYNGLVSSRNKVKDQWSQIDVQLKKRADLIPNIVETVKGYAKHEKDTLKEVIELRNGVYDKMSDDEKIKTNEQLSNNINRMMALAESYPELKASDNFKDLSKQLTKVEDDIANSRKYYNGIVRIYNNKVEMFPNNIFACIFRFKTKSMFEASANERENVKVEL